MSNQEAVEVHCWECGKRIKTRVDLITAMDWLRVKPFHVECFGGTIQCMGGLITKNEPVNRNSYLVRAIIIPIIVLPMVALMSMLFIQISTLEVLMLLLMSALTLLPVLIRYRSWHRYERHLRQ